MGKNYLNKTDIISKSKGSDNLTSVYIILTGTNSLLSKTIGVFTDSKYNHASISFDLDLDRMFSFGFSENDVTPGFTVENIDTTFLNNKLRSNREKIECQVYSVIVTEEQSMKMRFKINEYLSLKNKMKYSFAGLFGHILNKPVTRDNKMLCSEFVDSMLKFSDIDLTKKNSSLVAPVDFEKIEDDRVDLIYEGYLKDYNKSKVQSRANRYLYDYKKKSIKESTVNINEAKEFPVQFDSDGNLIIKNFKRLNYEKEYNNSHKLLLIYDKHNNRDGMKYELSKLWFINNVIEDKIFNDKMPDEKRKVLLRTRARILNDFNKYLKIITKNEKDFNFTEYYNETPFSDVYIKVNKNTLTGFAKLIKAAIL